jgi:protein TonB
MSVLDRPTEGEIGASLRMPPPAERSASAPEEALPDPSTVQLERVPRRIHPVFEWVWPASAAFSLAINLAVAALLIFPPRSATPAEPEAIPVELVRLAPAAATPAATTAPAQPVQPKPVPVQPLVQPQPQPEPPKAAAAPPPIPAVVTPTPLAEPLPPPPKRPVVKRKPPPIPQFAQPVQRQPPPEVIPVQPAPAPAAAPAAPPRQQAALPPATEPLDSNGRGAMSLYATRLRALIEAKKSYPPQALRRQEEGSVTLHIVVDHNGRLLQVTASSDAPNVLVDAALEAVREAAPFPAFPSALERQRETFELPIVFKLE